MNCLAFAVEKRSQDIQHAGWRMEYYGMRINTPRGSLQSGSDAVGGRGEGAPAP
jgi:hypothetical protein